MDSFDRVAGESVSCDALAWARVRRTAVFLCSVAALVIGGGVGWVPWPYAEGATKQTVLELERSVVDDALYVPGGTIVLRIRLAAMGPDRVTVLGLEETLPAGWQFDGLVGGDPPFLAPNAGDTGLLEFAWIPIPGFPVEFTYRIQAPARAVGTYEVVGEALYSYEGAGGGRRTGLVNTAIEPQNPPRTFYVQTGLTQDGDGSLESPFRTLALALDATEPDRADVVMLGAGNYAGNVTLKPTVRLLGEGAFHTRFGAALPDSPAVTLDDGCILRGILISFSSTCGLMAVSCRSSPQSGRRSHCSTREGP